MKKGVAEISTFVVIFLSLVIIILGFVLVKNISNVTAALPSPKEYFFTASVFPEKAQLGTVFNIKVQVESVNRSNIYRIDAQIFKVNTFLSEIPLFDDGDHGDGKANDGVYSNTFDSANYGEGVYSADIIINPVENKNSYKNSASFQVFKKNCMNIKYNGDPSEKIDVVFVPSDYKDMNKFMNDVIRFIDFSGRNKGILAYEPLKSNADKFNFYLVNQTNDLECSLNCGGISSMMCCNDNKVSEAASQCPADQIIVIKDINTFCGTASYYAKVCNILKGPQVLSHEFGHSFGGLGDEYSYSSTYPGYDPGEYNYPNCDKENCPKWNNLGLQNVGCYQGCGISNAFRSTPHDCIMFTYVDQYCPVDVLNLRKLLDNYSPQKSQGMAPPEKAYIINLNYSKNKLTFNDAYLTQTTAPDRKITRKAEYKARLLSESGKTIYNFNFDISRTENPFFENENSSKPGPVVYTDSSRLITVPYFNDAAKMNVYDLKNNKVLEVDLSYFRSQCGNDICESNENSVQCSQDCPENKKDSLCTYSDNGICDPDCMSIDPDCKKFSAPMMLNLAAILILSSLLVVFLTKKKEKPYQFL